MQVMLREGCAVHIMMHVRCMCMCVFHASMHCVCVPGHVRVRTHACVLWAATPRPPQPELKLQRGVLP